MTHAPFMPPERRASLMAMFCGGLGYSTEDAALVIDLAVHAVIKASEASALVAESAPHPALGGQIIMLSAQLMEEQCAGFVAAMREAAQDEGAFELSTRPV